MANTPQPRCGVPTRGRISVTNGGDRDEPMTHGSRRHPQAYSQFSSDPSQLFSPPRNPQSIPASDDRSAGSSRSVWSGAPSTSPTAIGPINPILVPPRQQISLSSRLARLTAHRHPTTAADPRGAVQAVSSASSLPSGSQPLLRSIARSSPPVGPPEIDGDGGSNGASVQYLSPSGWEEGTASSNRSHAQPSTELDAAPLPPVGVATSPGSLGSPPTGLASSISSSSNDRALSGGRFETRGDDRGRRLESNDGKKYSLGLTSVTSTQSAPPSKWAYAAGPITGRFQRWAYRHSKTLVGKHVDHLVAVVEDLGSYPIMGDTLRTGSQAVTTIMVDRDGRPLIEKTKTLGKMTATRTLTWIGAIVMLIGLGFLIGGSMLGCVTYAVITDPQVASKSSLTFESLSQKLMGNVSLKISVNNPGLLPQQVNIGGLGNTYWASESPVSPGVNATVVLYAVDVIKDRNFGTAGMKVLTSNSSEIMFNLLPKENKEIDLHFPSISTAVANENITSHCGDGDYDSLLGLLSFENARSANFAFINFWPPRVFTRVFVIPCLSAP